MKYTVEDYLLAKKLFGSGGKEAKRLPDEYQEVEYLESTGTQYIDTLVIPNNETGVSIKIAVSDITTDRFLFGCRQTSGDTRYSVGVQNTIYFGFNTVYKYSDTWVPTPNSPFVANLNYMNNRLVDVDGNPQKALSPISTTFTYSCIMFGRNSAGAITSNAQKIYFCKMTQGSALVREFVPCYRKSNGVIGMYDLIGKTFYVNAGTGIFTKGRDVRYVGEPPFIVPEYLGSTFKLGKSKLYG